MIVKVGDFVLLKCNVIGRFFLIVKWEKFVGGLLLIGGREYRDYVLDFGKVKLEYRGFYKCIV